MCNIIFISVLLLLFLWNNYTNRYRWHHGHSWWRCCLSLFIVSFVPCTQTLLHNIILLATLTALCYVPRHDESQPFTCLVHIYHHLRTFVMFFFLRVFISFFFAVDLYSDLGYIITLLFYSFRYPTFSLIFFLFNFVLFNLQCFPTRSLS